MRVYGLSRELLAAILEAMKMKLLTQIHTAVTWLASQQSSAPDVPRLVKLPEPYGQTSSAGRSAVIQLTS